MGDIEEMIFAAWERVKYRVEDNPSLLCGRIARRRRAVLSRPPRAWCLALRACDRRIASGCVDEPEEHRVRIDAELLRRVCGPVWIDSGQSTHDAARKLGTTAHQLVTARVKGTFRVRYVMPVGGRGKPEPLLNVDGPLDGCRREWKQADKAWGWAARFQLDRVPEDFVAELVRVPRFRSVVSKHRYDGGGHPEVEGAPRRAGRRLGEAPPQAVDLACWYKWSLPNDREPLGHYLGDDPSNWRRSFKDRGNRPAKWKAKPWKNWNRKPRPSVSKGSIQFNGFRWRCPVCGKECKTVYLPTPPVNLLEKVQPRIAQCVDVLRKVKGFACGQCHGVRNARWEIGREWNAVVSYLSGGLLYGREVKRPEWFSTGRQNAFAARLNARPAARRMRVAELMAAGWTARQIAAEMEVKLGTVYCYAWRGRRERADEVRGSRDGRVSEERFSRVE